jgi:hypothetical protein
MSNRLTQLSRSFVVAVSIAGVLALAARVVSAQDARCPHDDPRVVGVAVTFDRSAATVEVEPTSVAVYLNAGEGQPHRVCWTVAGLADGDELRLENKDPDSPDYFPGLQRKVTNHSPFLNSGNPSRTGTWQYSVVVRDGSGTILAELDPEVIVRGGGGH